jgi:hypothetical protein
MKEIERLINVLGVSEDEALRALLSAFASVQPGPLKKVFNERPEYGTPPETREIWELLVKSNFKCALCSTHYDLTIDHVDRDTKNNSLSNLRVLCRDCNRSVNSRGLKNKHAGLRVYKAIMDILDKEGRFPSDLEVMEMAGLDQLSGARYMIRFFESKYGAVRPLRKYRKK